MLTYSARHLSLAEKSVERLNKFIMRLKSHRPGEPSPDLDQYIFEAKSRGQEAMDENFNLPMAMGHMFAFVKKINRLMTQGLMDQEQIERVLEFMRSINLILAVIDFDKPAVDPEVERLIMDREKARQNGEYALADRIREELAQMGHKDHRHSPGHPLDESLDARARPGALCFA